MTEPFDPTRPPYVQPYQQPPYGQAPHQQQPYGQPYQQVPYGYGPPASEDPTLAVLVHLSLFAFGIIAPVVLYVVKKDSSPFLRHHAAQAINFHLTVTIAAIVSFLLVFVLIGLVLLPVVLIASAVFAIIAAVAAGKGQLYRYPLAIPFVH